MKVQIDGVSFQDENLHEVHSMIEADHDNSDIKLKETFEQLHQGIRNCL